jgi:hypothetical protein
LKSLNNQELSTSLQNQELSTSLKNQELNMSTIFQEMMFLTDKNNQELDLFKATIPTTKEMVTSGPVAISE